MTKAIITASIVVLMSGAAFAADMDGAIMGGRTTIQPLEPISGGPEVSQPQRASGFIEGRYTHGELADFDIDGDSWALRGSVNLDTGSVLNVQLDGSYTRTYIEDAAVNSYAGMVHAYARPNQDYAIGAFFGAGRIGTGYFDGYGIDGSDELLTDYVGGIEGAVFTDFATLYGRAGYGRTQLADYLDGDHYLGTLGARLYATDNLRFDAEGSFNRLEGYGGHIDIYTASATANYRPDGLPMTVFGGYRFDQFRIGDSGGSYGHENVNSVFAGLRFDFGSKSLKDEERSGPIWSNTDFLP